MSNAEADRLNMLEQWMGLVLAENLAKKLTTHEARQLIESFKQKVREAREPSSRKPNR
jgi:hypothetical protein